LSRAHDKSAKKSVQAVPLDIGDIEEVEILIPKNARGVQQGSKEYHLNQKMATESLKHQFGVPSPLVTDKGVAKDGDKVNTSSFNSSMLACWQRSSKPRFIF
jgi:hypothetical protein